MLQIDAEKNKRDHELAAMQTQMDNQLKTMTEGNRSTEAVNKLKNELDAKLAETKAKRDHDVLVLEVGEKCHCHLNNYERRTNATCSN